MEINMVPKYQAVVVSKGKGWFQCTFSRYLESSDLQAIKNHYDLLPGFEFYFRANENVVSIFINKGYTIDDVLQDFKELLNSLGFDRISWEVWRFCKNGKELLSSNKSEDLGKVLATK